MSNSESKNTPSILLVDNDRNITSLLEGNLQSEGYRVMSVPTAEDALMLPLETFNLVITEIRLPGEIDGFELLDRMKEDRMTSHIPVVFCTVLDTENDIIAGLNSGADDYVIKPFSLREFMARVRSVLRRHRNFAPVATARTIEYRTLILNVDSRGLIIDGDTISLSPTEFTILTCLMRSRNKLFTREEIFATAWPGEEMNNPRLVDVNISRLRKKLGAYGQNIVNRSGLGYGFMDM
ncbi:MAG: response regulator transcription factor [Duncaniella sp.]|uniref:response regulator transcription factor n=1 Tax=Duncaniella sp. TaxID=2518496 RepID=UPI0019CA13C6|nr:response regulator transcription factor [Duncaniella sp.]MBD5313346.1 response regulator transcription factor [Bacteroides sp.]MDE6090675.1 response regulator transcription factor [Duncaniella sp.]